MADKKIKTEARFVNDEKKLATGFAFLDNYSESDFEEIKEYFKKRIKLIQNEMLPEHAEIFANCLGKELDMKDLSIDDFAKWTLYNKKIIFKGKVERSELIEWAKEYKKEQDAFIKKQLSTGDVIKGFESNLTDEQIKALYKELQATYINTTLNNFREIFKPHQLSNNFKPIERKTKFTVRLLAYFVVTLFKRSNPKYPSITQRTFKDAENISQAKDGYENSKTGKPRGHQDIDKILEPYLLKKTS